MTEHASSWHKASKLVEQISDLDIRREAIKSIQPNDQLHRQVKVFHQVYNLPIIPPEKANKDFSHITKHRLAMRFGLIVEEFMELCEAMDIRADINFYYLNEEEHWVKARSVSEVQASEAHDGQSLYFTYDRADGSWKMDVDAVDEDTMHKIVRERLQEAIIETDERNMVDVADACGDLKYVIAGFELEVGIPSATVLSEIQCSNMSKLGADGKPIYREDGKVLKGPNYFQADIHKVLVAHGMKIGAADEQRI